MSLSVSAARNAPGASCSGRHNSFATPDVSIRHYRPSERNTQVTKASELHGLVDLAQSIAHHAPLALERVVYPCSTQNCGDYIYRSTLDPSLRMEEGGINPVGIALLGLVLFYLTAAPGVLQGFIDTYVIAPIQERTTVRLQKSNIKLGRKLAVGGFGAVFLGEAISSVPGVVRRGQKLIVKKATEFGEAEVWMNERLSRAAPQSCATFLTAYAEGASTNVGTPLVLVWKYEGANTLDDLMKDRFFPKNVEKALLGRELKIQDPVERKLVSIKVIMQQLLENLASMHNTGIVHRDVKPQNMIVCESDNRLKMIDLGAAADLRIGINYVPNEYLLDPRFAPPQQYIMSPLTPTAPAAPIAALLCPVLWRLNQPDRFDMYSAGIIMLQLVFPSIRSDNGIIAFNTKLEQVDYDMRAWRESLGAQAAAQYQEGFAILDADNGGGWELVCKLVTFKPTDRLSAAQALQQPWFTPVGEFSIGSQMSGLSSALGGSVDSAMTRLDPDGTLEKVLSGNRDSFSEVTLWTELGKDEEPPESSPTAAGVPPRTIAWWQKREEDAQRKNIGLNNSYSKPAPPSNKRLKAKRIVGNATQRAYGGRLSGQEVASGKKNGSRGNRAQVASPEDTVDLDENTKEGSQKVKAAKKMFGNLFGKR